MLIEQEQIVKKVREGTKELTSSSEEMAASSEEISGASQEIASSIQEVAEGAENQNQSVIIANVCVFYFNYRGVRVNHG